MYIHRYIDIYMFILASLFSTIITSSEISESMVCRTTFNVLSADHFFNNHEGEDSFTLYRKNSIDVLASLKEHV